MIIFTGALTMTMCRTGNPTDALGVVATADAPDGASPPGDTGEAQNDARSQRMIRVIRSGIFPGEHACLFGGLLACFFSAVVVRCFDGQAA